MEHENWALLDSDGSHVDNKASGVMEVQVWDWTYIVDAPLESGAHGRTWLQSLPMGLPMCAANGTEIPNLGRKVFLFRGIVIRRRAPLSRVSAGECDP